MSVQSEIDRIITAVGNAYSKVSEKGGTVPASQTVANLATAIGSIPAGGTPSLQSKSVTYTSNGTSTITPDEGYDGLSSVDVTVDVSGGGGGGTGFKVTFPATATNWQSFNYTMVSHLWLSDGTIISMGGSNYSNVAGKTLDGVIGLYVETSVGGMVPRITLTGSVAINSISITYGITTDGATPARFNMPGKLIFLFLSDATISSIEMYNTD